MIQKPCDLVISIDPGEKRSGLSIIMLSSYPEYNRQLFGFVLDNDLIIEQIRKYYVKYNIVVAIEDIKPYRQQLSTQLINTCKYLGELNYRLKSEFFVKTELISRGEVKKWVFDSFMDDSVLRINKKIAYLDGYGERNDRKRYRTKHGVLRKATFHFVDDRVVIAAMKNLWNIPTPKVGKSNIYGFASHSWQALAVGSYYLASKLGNDFIKTLQSEFLPFSEQPEIIP